MLRLNIKNNTSPSDITAVKQEIADARGTELTLKDKLLKIISSIITKHQDLEGAGSIIHSQLDNMYNDYEQTISGYNTLDEKLGSIKPSMNLSDLKDVDVTNISNGQTIIWDSVGQNFKPGNATGGGGGVSGELSGLSYLQTITQDSNGNVIQEIYSGNMNKTIDYTYENGILKSKTVTFEDGTTATASYGYDSNGNISTINDTGTDRILLSDAVASIQNAVAPLLQKITQLESANIKIQFKYDMAFNFNKNFCADYFIDVLQDATNIESFQNCSYSTTSENIS